MKIGIPPIKSQGIKSKLVSWIHSVIPQNFAGKWIEPFMGTGVVAFNLAPQDAILCDTNPHLINFYIAISKKIITPESVGAYLTQEGKQLLTRGEKHFYEIRERFNSEHSPLDFLFVNRAGFNGMIRFNRKGGYNIPFCRKPNRFAQAYVTKIVNQVKWVAMVIQLKKFKFRHQPFAKTIAEATQDDIVYCDPPYIDRHADYFNNWQETEEKSLAECLSQLRGKFILSTWHHNDFRENNYIKSIWNQYNVLTRSHFYHVGAKESNRNSVTEALILNYKIVAQETLQPTKIQLKLFEKQ